MANRALVKIKSADEKLQQLRSEMNVAQEELRLAEAQLGEEQAAVNAFRMHCRLTLGPWVDQIIELYTEKQLILIRKRMKQQADELGSLFDEEKWLEDEGYQDNNAMTKEVIALPSGGVYAEAS